MPSRVKETRRDSVDPRRQRKTKLSRDWLEDQGSGALVMKMREKNKILLLEMVSRCLGHVFGEKCITSSLLPRTVSRNL